LVDGTVVLVAVAVAVAVAVSAGVGVAVAVAVRVAVAVGVVVALAGGVAAPPGAAPVAAERTKSATTDANSTPAHTATRSCPRSPLSACFVMLWPSSRVAIAVCRPSEESPYGHSRISS